MDTLSVGNEYAADTGNSEYAFCDVIHWLKEQGYRIVTLQENGGYLMGGSYVNPSVQILKELQ